MHNAASLQENLAVQLVNIAENWTNQIYKIYSARAYLLQMCSVNTIQSCLTMELKLKAVLEDDSLYSWGQAFCTSFN